jgi:3-polyprenyl-4-hydroxybenzoate decarboxylase
MYYGEAGRLIVGVTGASGVVYAKRLLEVLKEKNIESHVIVSRAAEIIIKHELEKRELISRSLEDTVTEKMKLMHH